MHTVSVLVTMVSTCLLALTIPGSLYLLILTLAGSLPARRRQVPRPTAPGRLAMIVPAHNEAAGLRRTLTNLLQLAQVDGNADVIVVADNCNDDTAEIARATGARVLERQDPKHRGKGYALDYAFRVLMPEGHDGYVIIDADSLAAPNLLPSLRQHFAGGAKAIQTRYTVLNGDEAHRTQLAEVALAAFNVLRPRGRERLGLSAGILGNGFALRRDTLERVPYRAISVVEDLEYHLKLVSAGIRVEFADDTEVRGDMPFGEQGSRTQRARWEGGRLRMLLQYGPGLASAVLHGHWRLLEPLLDLLLLPLAYHALLLLAAGLLAAAAVTGWAWPLWMTVLASLSLLAIHVLAAMHITQQPWSRLRVLTRIPAYLAWKVGMLTTTVSSAARGSAWIRTERDGA